MSQRVYVDNSVIGGLFDDEFSFVTKRLFNEFDSGIYIPVISSVTLQEIQGAPKNVLSFLNHFRQKTEILQLTEEVVELSQNYLKEGKFTKRMLVDTLHIAIARVNNVGIIVSWNFHDIVNLDKIRVYNAVNIMHGFQTVEIRSPREIIHEEKI
jgi:predicted nucleic acid-binding protein